MVSSDRDDENWEDREVAKFGRLRRFKRFGRSKIFRSRQIRDVGKFESLGRSGVLE
jgi:hypothetical protein